MSENWRERCDWCGFPLDPLGQMCKASDCSMRPRPSRPDTELRQECRKAERERDALKGEVEYQRARCRVLDIVQAHVAELHYGGARATTRNTVERFLEELKP